jgi:hypothetical protein
MQQMLTLDVVRTHDATIILATNQIPLSEDNHILRKDGCVLAIRRYQGILQKAELAASVGNDWLGSNAELSKFSAGLI